MFVVVSKITHHRNRHAEQVYRHVYKYHCLIPFGRDIYRRPTAVADTNRECRVSYFSLVKMCLCVCDA